MYGVGDFWLETRVIIRIESHPFYGVYHINFENFLGDEAEKNILFNQRPIPEMFVRKFLELAVQKISVFLNRPFCTFYQNIFLYLIANQSKGRIDGTQF